LTGIIYFLANLSIVSSLFPLFFLIFGKKFSSAFFLKLFVLELVVVNVLNLVLFYFTDFDQINLFSIHNLIEKCLIFLIFNKLKNRGFFNEKLSFSFIVINLGVFLFLLNHNANDRFNYFSTFSIIFMSLFSVLIIIDRYINSQFVNLFDDFSFNLSAAILLYNGLQLYVIFFNSLILQNADKLFLYTWPIVQISSILYYILISRAIWKLKN